MSGLPREILKWMQSLDLSYSVKNVKRDFANGFLVAEILSRYYKSDISLHSFDNGLGLVKRMENWSLIDKFLRKIGSPIDRSLIDQVIHCKKDAAIPLMEQLYTMLTHKTIQATRPVRDVEVVPAFARPTASQLIKERMSEADLAHANTLDHSVAPGKAAKVLAEHMQKLKLERETDPARFQPKATAPAAAAAASASKHAPRKSATESTFKEVTVRQVDDKGGVLQMRANHVYNARSPSHQQSARSNAPASPTHHAAGAAAQAASPTAAAAAASHAHSSSFSASTAGAGSHSGKASLSALSSTLLIALGPAGADLAASASSSGKEAITLFCEGEVLRLADGHAAYVIGSVTSQCAPYLADQSLSNPKEFWQTCGVFFSLLDRLSHDSLSFAATVAAFSNLGVSLVSRDAPTSTELWFDFAFAKYANLLRTQPRKTFQTAKVAYTFIADAPEEHGRLIRSLHEELLGGAVDQPPSDAHRRIFFSIVAALAPFEGPLLVSNNFQLLNSYLKLVSDGMGPQHSARTRATALSVLAPLAANQAFDERPVRIIIDKLQALLPAAVEEEEEEEEEEQDAAAPPRRRGAAHARGLAGDEWLLDAELLHVLSCLLSQPWVLSQADLVSNVHAWVELLLCAQGAPYPTVRAGLAHLTHVLGSQPPLRRIWLAVLLEDDQLRSRLLASDSAAGDSAASDEPAGDLAESFCPSLRAVWHPLTVAQSLADHVRVSGLDNLALGHIELLAAASDDAFGAGAFQAPDGSVVEARPPFPDSEALEWAALFVALRDHLVVELCEANLSDLVIAILRRFLLDPRTAHAATTIFLPPSDSGAAAAAAAGGAGAASSAAPPLYCIMRFMFPSAPEEAQMNLAGFLEELAALPQLVALVHRNLRVFADNESDKFAGSPLGPLLDKLDQQAAQAGISITQR